MDGRRCFELVLPDRSRCLPPPLLPFPVGVDVEDEGSVMVGIICIPIAFTNYPQMNGFGISLWIFLVFLG